MAKIGRAAPRSGASLEVRLARSSAEVEAVQRLRFRVFNLDQGIGLADSHSSGLDHDRYDPFCDHLLVIDHAADDAVVGTYRLLAQERAPPFGFYSETEFDLTRVRNAGLRLLELGRSCVAPGYRYGRIIDLLFRGIGGYVRATRSQALMGCVSVHGREVPALRQICAYLQREGLMARPELAVTPLATHAIPGVEAPPETLDLDAAERLPPLFRAYLRLGCRICGPPAFDAEFGVTDFFVLLDLTNVTDAYARRFLT